MGLDPPGNPAANGEDNALSFSPSVTIAILDRIRTSKYKLR